MSGLLDLLMGAPAPQAPQSPVPLMAQGGPVLYDPEVHGPPTSLITETWQGRMPGSTLPSGATAKDIQAEWDAAKHPRHPLPGAQYELVTPNGEQTGSWDFITGEGDRRYPDHAQPRVWTPDTKMWRRIIERPMS